MPVKSLKVNFLQSGADEVKYSIDQVTAKVDKFGDKSVTAKVGVDDKSISPKLTDIQARMDALAKRKVTMLINADSSKAQYDLARFGQKMDALSRKTANPNISLNGVDRAEVQLLGLEASMDSLSDRFGADGSKGASDFNRGLEGGDGVGLMSPQVIIPLVAAGLAVMPGLFAIAGAAGAAALGVALAVKGSPALQKSGEQLLSSLETTMEGAAQVLDKPIAGAISDVKAELPQIGQLFGQTFGLVGPLIRPMVSMLTDLVVDVMPGFNSLMKQAAGPLADFFNAAGKIVGTNLGSFLAALGPGVRPSLSILQSLLSITTSLLTPMAQLANVAAHIVAPALFVVGQNAAESAGSLGKFDNAAVKAATSTTSTLPIWAPLARLIFGVGTSSNKAASASDAQTKAVNANRLALINSVDAAQHAAGAQVTLQSALSSVVTKINNQDSALQTADQAWERYFGILGSGQAALSTVSTDITNATQALKQYGSGSLEARAAVSQLIQDDETLITSLMSQAKAAGNTSAANTAMKNAFLDAARSQVTTAASSKTLQDALVLQAQQAGINVNSWAQLKSILAQGKGGLDAASKSTDDLSQQQETNTQMSARMMQAQKILTGTLAQAQSQGKLTSLQVADLSSAVKYNIGQVDTSRSAFEQFASQLGISKGKADSLWTSLKNVRGDYAANVKVSVTGGGTVKVQGSVAVDTGTGIATSLNTGEQTFNGYSYARGGLITMGTGPTADDVIIRASKNETVVSAAHSKQLAPVFRAVGVPGYANGGLIGASATNSFPASVASLIGNFQEPKFATSVGANISKQTVTELGSAIKTGIKDAIAAIQELGSGPLGQGVSGGEMANGRQLYDYLLSNVFGGAKIAAAGAVASIWGESTWNPFAQGTGGRGLIGWTPPGSISDAAFNGGMATQLPAIVRFIGTSGDWGVINEMRGATSILDAANLWGKGVERYGINDVHSTGLALAAEIMGGSTVSVNKKTGIGTSQVTGEQTFNGYSYDNGGLIPEPVQGYGLRTGKDYMFHANEWVTPSGRHISNGSGGGDVYNIAVQGDTDPDGAALRIIQKVRDYKRHHGGQATGIG